MHAASPMPSPPRSQPPIRRSTGAPQLSGFAKSVANRKAGPQYSDPALAITNATY